MNKFEKIRLSEELLKSINELVLKTNTYSKKYYPCYFEGYDVIGQAQTGTGKTLAFSSILLKFKRKKRNHRRIFYHQQENFTMQIHEELKTWKI